MYVSTTKMQQLEITHRVLQTVLKLVTITTDDDFVRNIDSLTISLNFMKTRIFTVLNREVYWNKCLYRIALWLV